MMIPLIRFDAGGGRVRVISDDFVSEWILTLFISNSWFSNKIKIKNIIPLLYLFVIDPRSIYETLYFSGEYKRNYML
jgi:hypothetical protein